MWCERGHKVRSDLTKLQPLNNVAKTLCVSWDTTINHINFFNHKRYSNDTELSKYIWKLKDNKQNLDLTWSVLKQYISYTGR